jgi:chain length determinant protein EpsF
MHPKDDRRTMTFQQFLLILRARWRLAVGVFGGIVLASLVVTLLSSKKYTATASVVVDARNDLLTGASLEQLPNGYIATQVDIVGSVRVAQRAGKLLKLDQDPSYQETWKEETGGRGDLTAWIAEGLQESVTVEPSRESSVVEIKAKWRNAKMAAQIANAFAQAYIDTVIELKVDPAKQYAGWFDQRTRELRADLEAKQKLLSDFENEHQITATDEHLDIETARLGELSSQLTAIQAQRQDSQSRQHQTGASNDSLPEVLQNPLIASLKSDLARAEAHLQDIATNLGSNHPAYKNTEAEVASLRDRIAQESARVAGSLATATQVNVQRENDIRQALEAQKQRVLQIKHERDQLDILRGDVGTAQHNLDSVAQRFAQVSLESRVQQTNAVLLTAASEPLAPSSPKLLLNVALGILLGAVFGIAAALIFEFADPRIRGDEELAELLSVPLLGRLKSSFAQIQRASPTVRELGHSST